MNIIRTSGSNLLGLIDSILDLARIEAGAMELDVGEFDLVECVDAAVATSAVPARAKGLQMAVVIEPSVVARSCWTSARSGRSSSGSCRSSSAA